MSKLAVIKTGGKQYKVAEGDTIQVEKIEGKEGKKINFSDILLLSDDKGKEVEIGNPALKSHKVEAEIIRQFRDKKVTVIKYKAKVRYRRKAGHKQSKTELKITKI